MCEGVAEAITLGLAEALERAGEQPDQFATRALASYVDDFYSGVERICERVAVTLDGDLPTGEQWHPALLYQMGQPYNDHPPLFPQNLLSDTDEYRRFCHRLRHSYGRTGNRTGSNTGAESDSAVWKNSGGSGRFL